MTVRQLNDLLKTSLSPFDAQNILEHLLCCTRSQLVLRYDEELSDDIVSSALSMKKRREQGEPIQYILGFWSFMGREFEVTKGVLIPRDDTEVVVCASLALILKDEEKKILDLCAGSGIIAVTIKKERPLCRVSAVEKSETAYACLRKNAEKNEADIGCILSDLSDCADRFEDESLDLIVSNPPYIKTAELKTLQREVQFEPMMALDGGASGFDFYEKIIALYTKKLKIGGIFAFEIGEGQKEVVSALLKDAGFRDIRAYPDIQNIPRAITAVKSI